MHAMHSREWAKHCMCSINSSSYHYHQSGLIDSPWRHSSNKCNNVAYKSNSFEEHSNKFIRKGLRRIVWAACRETGWCSTLGSISVWLPSHLGRGGGGHGTVAEERERLIEAVITRREAIHSLRHNLMGRDPEELTPRHHLLLHSLQSPAAALHWWTREKPEQGYTWRQSMKASHRTALEEKRI